MKNIFKIHFIVFLALQSVYAQVDNRPNIILIMVDDLGYADLKFNLASSDILSPNIDNLANNGTICTSGYAAHPFCGPSRAGLMSGRYPHAIGSQFNIADFNFNNASRDGLNFDVGVPTTERFFSKVLKDANYHTGLVGKWHLGTASQYYPNARGFDYFYGIPGGGHYYFPDEYKQRQQGAGQFLWDYYTPLEVNGADATDDNEYITDLFSDKAIDFVKNAPNDKPYFLFLSYNAPHSPLQAKSEDEALFPNLTGGRKTYAAMVYAVDRGVGELVQALTDEGDLNNTLIVFLSDNGGRTDAIGEARNFPLRGRKGDVYEGGYRVPMFFYWPGVVPAGRKYDHVVSALDLYPTFVNLANAESSLPSGKVLDGVDIWDDFIAGNDARSEPLFAMRHNSSNSNVAAREGKWKAVKYGTGNWQLFNLDTDISEQSNVINANPQIAANLITKAKSWSQTHTEPLFFHSKTFADLWASNNMPNFEQTFEVKNSNVIPHLSTDLVIGGNVLNIAENPFSDLLKISLNSKVKYLTIDMINSLGQSIKQIYLSNTDGVDVDTSSLASGIYYIYISTENSSVIKKVVKI